MRHRPELEAFGRELARRRQKAGLSARQLSELLPETARCTGAAIRSYEQARHTPSYPTVIVLDEALKARYLLLKLDVESESLIRFLAVDERRAPTSASREALLAELQAVRQRLDEIARRLDGES